MEEPEVELIEYLHVVSRWKVLIALGTLGCVLAVGIVSVLLPKTYRISAIIDTGDLGETGEKDVERLVARLNAGAYLPGGDGSTGR